MKYKTYLVFLKLPWASAPMGKTRHLPGPGIWHLWNFRYKTAHLNKNLGVKGVEIVFCPVQNMVCSPQKTDLRTPMVPNRVAAAHGGAMERGEGCRQLLHFKGQFLVSGCRKILKEPIKVAARQKRLKTTDLESCPRQKFLDVAVIAKKATGPRGSMYTSCRCPEVM